MSRRRVRSRLLFIVSSLALPSSLACSGSSAADGGVDTEAASTGEADAGSADASESGTDGGVEPDVSWVHLECDPLVPEYCGLPFPSNVFTVDADDTPTGRRISFEPGFMPTSYYDVKGDPTPWSRGDGFSPGAGIMTFLPRATSNGLPSSAQIEASLADDSPTILLDAQTGERIAHFAELDATANDPSQAVLFLRPATRLKDATRYIVALRGVVDEAGAALPPSPAFAALRDGTNLDEEGSVQERRGLYADIFGRLEDAGIGRGDLQLAWDFTTSSAQNDTAWMLHMRDDALADLGTDGPSFTIDEIDEAFDERIAYKIEGTFQVPLYLTETGPSASWNFGDDGLPARNGMVSYPFELLIPTSATQSPASLLQFGHGLLGTRREIESDELLDLANEYNYALFATDWVGLSAPDQPFIAAILDSGELEKFDGMYARLHQAMLNALVLMRRMSTEIATDDAWSSLLDPEQRYYYGISLGGIMGTVYTALSTDVTRSGLEVMGAPFNLLLGRSKQFDLFFDILRANYTDPRDAQMVLALTQLLWDRIEPTGYLPHLSDQPLPNTPEHTVLMRAAIGDHSVTNLGAHFMVRSLDIPQLEGGGRDIWGITTEGLSREGSAYIEYDFGLPEAPICSVPMRSCRDPHSNIRRLPAAAEQLDRFFETGVVENLCEGDRCLFESLSGCGGNEPPPQDACEGF